MASSADSPGSRSRPEHLSGLQPSGSERGGAPPSFASNSRSFAFASTRLSATRYDRTRHSRPGVRSCRPPRRRSVRCSTASLRGARCWLPEGASRRCSCDRASARCSGFGERPCACCGRTFLAVSQNQKFCTRRCMHRGRRRDESKYTSPHHRGSRRRWAAVVASGQVRCRRVASADAPSSSTASSSGVSSRRLRLGI